MTSSGQSAWNPNDPLSEGVIYEKRLADDIGQQWRDLARALGFHHSIIEDIQQEKGNSKECCIEVLVRWLRQNGKGATAEKLVEALTKIGLKNLADRFPIKPSDTNRNSKENSKVRELEDRVSKMENKNIKELEEEVSKMKHNNKKLEEEVSKLRAINKELQDGEKQEVEVSKMKTKNKELEEEVSRLRAINKKLQDGEKQDVEVSKFKELEEEVSKMKHNNKELEEEVSKLRAINKELQDGEKQEVEVSKMKTKNKELEEEVSKFKELEEEVSKMKHNNKELEEEVSKLRAINKKLQDGEKQDVEVSKFRELEEEVSKMKNKNKELEEEVSKLRAINKKLQDSEKQEVEVSKIKELEEKVSKMKNNNKELEEEDLEHKLSKETDEEARERRISEKLQKYIRDLKTYVTSSLEVPEVKQDQLKTPVKLDILKTLSEHLGDLYIGTRDMVSETCKCSEDLKREFYDFGYHGLRADHNELIHRVKDLDDTVQGMSEEEQEELQKLKEFQMNRESLIKELEEKWRALFSPPERLSRTRSFLTIGRGEKSTDNKKVKRNTDPGTRPKQRNVRDKRLQNPKHLSIGRKTLKRLQYGTLHYQRLNES
ncbi:uncharacterized protein PF3D7_1120000-like isoform X2 [Montipora capricornis]|uniref:uncharacterized protein PF3D7_1120000-like isoform X2 n=1 Tax=Montipora capricornis TaxID=246305 RepID=UPI0035F1E1BA